MRICPKAAGAEFQLIGRILVFPPQDTRADNNNFSVQIAVRRNGRTVLVRQWCCVDALKFGLELLHSGFLGLFGQPFSVELGNFTIIIADHHITVGCRDFVLLTISAHIAFSRIAVQAFSQHNFTISDMKSMDDFIITRHPFFHNHPPYKLARLVVGYTYAGKPVTAGDLHAQGAMAALLKDALKPNLVQTLEHTPAFVHGGPFANIAHGCNSVTATKIALKLGDYAITEAGFGADLGAEKFLDIKCRMAGLKPSCVVLVATARALKYNGGVPKAETGKENLEALEKGLPNLLQHVSNITTVYKLPCVVAINRFPTDTEAELKLIETKCKELGVNVALSEVWGKGGEGGVELAKEVIRLCEQPNDFTFSYELNCSIKEKIEAIAKKIYHADGVNFTANAEKQIKTLTELGYDHMPICMAKTQYSFTDDQTKLGAPRDFTITVRNVKVSAGAGFLVALTGEIMTMPGLPKVPAAERIDVDETGKISGLF